MIWLKLGKKKFFLKEEKEAKETLGLNLQPGKVLDMPNQVFLEKSYGLGFV